MKNKIRNVAIFSIIFLIIIFGIMNPIKVHATENNISEDIIYGDEYFSNYNEFDIVGEKESATSISKIICAVISIFRTVSMFFFYIFLLIAIIRIYKNKKSETKKPVIRYFLFSGIIFLINGYLGITQTFKPIIYLYPEKEKDVEVKLGKPEKLTCTYPKYKDVWKVSAKPNGDLIYKENGKKLYSLYWEGKNNVKHDLSEGFIVKGEDTITFLEEKLEVLGLNEREAEEFILYWLPQLECNKYNFIRFESQKEIDEDMPLEIMPKPDTVIRIVMAYKKILKPFKVKEQVLKTPERKGFTVVEWGGTKI